MRKPRSPMLSFLRGQAHLRKNCWRRRKSSSGNAILRFNGAAGLPEPQPRRKRRPSVCSAGLARKVNKGWQTLKRRTLEGRLKGGYGERPSKQENSSGEGQAFEIR